MAEIAVASAIAVLRQAVVVLGNLVIQEGSHLFRLKEDLEWIENEMDYIQAYLEDEDAANNQQSESRVEAALLKNIRILAYDVEDVVETYFPQIAPQERKGCLGRLKSATCIFRRCFAAHNFVTEIGWIRRRVENIPRVRMAYGTRKNNDSNGGGRDIWDRRRHFLHLDEPMIVGFDEHIKTMVAKVLDPELRSPVISIVGMPGLGKTTLAKKVYDCTTASIKKHFDCSAKVYVSQRPNVKQLLQDIAKQVGLEKEKWEENVVANLSAYLKDERYVILLDDIWDTQVWDDLKIGIPNNSQNGSRIILTSRNREVGLYVGGVSSLYELQPLKPEDSWDLFVQMVMGPQEITDDMSNFQELESLGRKIVEKCGCLPLAIVVVAGLLLVKEKTEHAWKGVLESVGQDDDMCSKILTLSYKDLPIQLKPCFLYFGLFPEDYEIFAFQLINLWMAEGFVQARGQRTPEDVGEDYLSHLISRNIIQVARKSYDGRIRSCRIHDLLHNVCVRVASESNFFNAHNDVTTTNSTMRVRRITTYHNGTWESISSNFHTSKLRTMLSFPLNDFVSVPRRKLLNNIFECSGFLKVLHLNFFGGGFPCRLPNEIGNLRHLNYLGCGDLIAVIPSTIGNLNNLMTLDLQRCYDVAIPNVIWNMKSLRHILMSNRFLHNSDNPLIRGFPYSYKGCCGLIHQNEVSLPNLQTLYVVSRQLLEAEWLCKFTNLRKLGIWYPTGPIIKVLSGVMPVSNKLENLGLYVDTPTAYMLQNRDSQTTLNLSQYGSLRKLHLQIPMKKLPELPPNLIKLTLKRTLLEDDPMVTLKGLPKLKILKLGYFSYKGNKMVCTGAPHNFPQLEVLEIGRLFTGSLLNESELVVEEDGMPKLKKLSNEDDAIVLRIPARIKNVMTSI